ncbi:Na+/H+ antiporter NhaC family protein [Agaribacter flavus]|uniref:Na+/H+ antiporter NhaC family protein n=1 Tax=Agaribacter flavus TaxID=1902781 RepID=A0ABV7FUD1_9ALTE
MDWLSIIPPILAIAVVLWKKEVILGLLLAIIAAELLLLISNNQPLLLTPVVAVDRVVSAVQGAGNARILMFSLLVGALLAFIRDSGGVSALVNKLVNSGLASSKKKAGGITMLTGTVVFIESNLSVLSSGIMARGLFDKYKMSRARLAYIIDSTSAPICILILLNGWGAYILSLLSAYELEENALKMLWSSVPFNFYALLTLAVVAYTIFADKVHGPMKQAEQELARIDSQINIPQATKARFMLVPLSLMILGTLFFMWWTGHGNLSAGSGSRSVLYATFIASIVGYLMLVLSGRETHQSAMKIGFGGISELLPLVTIVLLSISLGASLKALGTGVFVANIVGEHLPLFLVLPALFVAGALMSFTTGTSWGTFAILIPIGMPLVETLGLPPELVLAAILGGGIFGDHCSPLSDTTAISSLAAGCDLLTHVKTQLPYALVVGAASVLLYIAAGLLVL